MGLLSIGSAHGGVLGSAYVEIRSGGPPFPLNYLNSKDKQDLGDIE